MVPHRFSINLSKEGYQKIINVRASDNEIHRLYISITSGTEPVELDNNIVATIYCFKPNGEKIWNNCKISNNEVICDFGGDILNCCGDVVCELFLSTLGTNIITPKFVLSVESTLPFPHFNLLEEQPENWLDEADLYYTKNENGDFVPVELNANRNLLSDIEFPYNTTIGNIEYRRTKALDFDFNRKLYISYYGSNPDITLRYEFYYSIKGNLTELIESYTSIKKTLEIIVPNITKRQLIEKGFDGIRLVLSIPTNCLTSEYKATDWVLEYDECSYKNCKTPYFEKGKYYIMTNDYGKSGEQYNALIKAITEAREFYNKAISDIKLVDNCLTIDFVNGEKYVSSSLKGNGIKSFAKVSTSGNVDTYEFVADNGEKFSFSVTNTDNSVLEEIKEKLENKVNIDIYNQKIAEIKNSINTLQTKKVGTDDFAKSMSELQSLVAEVKEYAINVNNEKLDITTFENAVADINNAITVLQNGKVDNGTYVDDMNAVNASVDSIVKNANALLEKIQSNETALNQKIDTVAIRGADMTTIPTLTTNIQKEGSTLAIYSTKLFSDTPSDTTTFSGNKINALLKEKIDAVNTNLSQQIDTVNGEISDVNNELTAVNSQLSYLDNNLYNLLEGEIHDNYFVYYSVNTGRSTISNLGGGYSLSTYPIEKGKKYVVKTNSSILRLAFNTVGFHNDYGLGDYKNLDGNTIYEFVCNGEYSYIHIAVKTPATPLATVKVYEVVDEPLPTLKKGIIENSKKIAEISETVLNELIFTPYNGYISKNTGVECTNSFTDTWVNKFLVLPKLPPCIVKIETRNNFYVRINKYEKDGTFIGVGDFVTEFSDFDFFNYDYIPQFKKNESTDVISPEEFSDNVKITVSDDYRTCIRLQEVCRNGWFKLESKIDDVVSDYISKFGMNINNSKSDYSSIRDYVISHNDFSKNGKLLKRGTKILNKDGSEIMLQGIGTHSLYEYKDLYTKNSIKTLKYYGINLIRISVYLSDTVCPNSKGRLLHGWLNHSEELKPIIENLIDNATENNMYILLDWHSYHAIDGGDVTQYQSQQEEFFTYFSTKYADYENILYELHNEPYQNTATELLPSVISCASIIRENNPDAILICGHGKSDNGVNAIKDMNNIFNGTNNLDIFISPHIYTGEQNTDFIKSAITAGLPIFVSEWGNSSLSGDNMLRDGIAYEMFELIRNHKISNALWKWTHQNMSTSVLVDDEYAEKYLYPFGGYTDGYLSHNGRFYFNQTFKNMIKDVLN